MTRRGTPCGCPFDGRYARTLSFKGAPARGARTAIGGTLLLALQPQGVPVQTAADNCNCVFMLCYLIVFMFESTETRRVSMCIKKGAN